MVYSKVNAVEFPVTPFEAQYLRLNVQLLVLQPPRLKLRYLAYSTVLDSTPKDCAGNADHQ